MVVCRFFQQGYCRFGQSCRFEHVYGSKYSYHAPQSQNNPPSQNTGVTDEQLLNQVHSDVQAALKGGQWLLSTYAPFKEKGLLPGLMDLSPEEARLFIYEAKANNNVDQAVAYMNSLFNEARSKYEQLLQPSPQLLKVLQSLYKGENVSTPFTPQETFGSSNSQATSIFRSAVQNTSIFDQNSPNVNSGFGQSNNIFGPSGDSNAKSIFAQATQNVFGPQTTMSSNMFGPSPDAAKSIFAQANQSSTNIFASPPPVNPASVFASASQQAFSSADQFFAQNTASMQNNQPTNVFQTPSSVFGAANNVFDQQTDDIHVYSKEDDLTVEDMEAFKSDTFTLGFIPELPPPKSVC